MSDARGALSSIDDALVERLDAAARAARLLVASDFDGTIAPIVADPEAAQADRGAIAALRTLVALPATRVAIVSGRALADLAARTAELDGAIRVGSHGAEFEAVLRGPASWPGVVVRHGKMVVELSVVEGNKGTALQRIRDEVGATVVVFFGDDVTDEDAFAVLTTADVGVKVGAGESRAAHHIATTASVGRLLARLAERRAVWIREQGRLR